MNKFKIVLLLTAMSLAFTSCLRDKGFENKQYGLDGIGEVGKKGVGIPESNTGITFRAIEVSSTPLVNYEFLYINLNSALPATEDVSVNLVLNNTLVTNYNNANAANLVAMPQNLYSFSALKVVIPKGTNGAYLKLNIPNSTLLSASSSYGFGISIATIDQPGYTIAANQRDIVVQLNAKNKFDGVWNLRGRHTRPTLDGSYNANVHLITSGEFSAYMFWPNNTGNFTFNGTNITFFGTNLVSHPLVNTAGAYTYYGTFTSNFIFNAANVLTAWDWTPYATTLPTAVVAGSNSRYVPGTPTSPARIFAHIFYNNNMQRAFLDTLTYLAPRP